MGETTRVSSTPETVVLTTLAALPLIGVVGLAVGVAQVYMAEKNGNRRDSIWRQGYNNCVTFLVTHTFYLIAVMVALLV